VKEKSATKQEGRTKKLFPFVKYPPEKAFKNIRLKSSKKKFPSKFEYFPFVLFVSALFVAFIFILSLLLLALLLQGDGDVDALVVVDLHGLERGA